MSESERQPRYRPAADLLGDWRDDVLSGTPPTLYPVGDGELARLEIGPGMITLIGGQPAAGKSALTMQLVCEALSRKPDLRALVASVEMSPPILLDRQLARLSGIDLNVIRYRQLGQEHADDLERGLEALDDLADRLAFVSAPFNLENVAASADDFGADLILLDYIQRIPPPGNHADRRNAVSATMDFLRQFADAGLALIVVAALGRGKSQNGGSSYAEGLSLASFRESSELEYGCDDAFILTLGPESDDGTPSPSVTMKHLKSRHGEMRDIPLHFDRPHQRFTPAQPEPRKAKPSAKPAVPPDLMATMQAAWSRDTREGGAS